MPAEPNMVWYDGASIIEDGNEASFEEVARGDTGLPDKTLNLWNDRNAILGSFTAKSIQISVVPTDGDYDSEVFTGTEENEFQPFFEARSRGSLNTSDDAQEDWTPISHDVFLSIGNMPANSMRVIELRAAVPIDAAAFNAKNFSLQVSYSYDND